MSQKELIENLNEILDQKNTILIPENIKSGINILGVEGSSYVVDTSDANLTADLMPINRTAYVKGEKLTGTLPLWYNFGYMPKTIAYEPFSSTDDTTYLTFTATSTSKFITHPTVDMTVKFRISDETKLAEAVGLTSDKLLEGNTILGIEGSAKGNTMQWGILNGTITIPANVSTLSIYYERRSGSTGIMATHNIPITVSAEEQTIDYEIPIPVGINLYVYTAADLCTTTKNVIEISEPGEIYTENWNKVLALG